MLSQEVIQHLGSAGKRYISELPLKMTDGKLTIKEKIKALRKLHSQLEKEIAKVIKIMPSDQVALQRLKKEA